MTTRDIETGMTSITEAEHKRIMASNVIICRDIAQLQSISSSIEAENNRIIATSVTDRRNITQLQSMVSVLHNDGNLQECMNTIRINKTSQDCTNLCLFFSIMCSGFCIMFLLFR